MIASIACLVTLTDLPAIIMDNGKDKKSNDIYLKKKHFSVPKSGAMWHLGNAETIQHAGNGETLTERDSNGGICA